MKPTRITQPPDENTGITVVGGIINTVERITRDPTPQIKMSHHSLGNTLDATPKVISSRIILRPTVTNGQILP